jgi:SulP family sulfate permease
VLVTLLHGSFSYASARDLAHRDTQSATPGDVVIYDFTHAGYMDPSAAMAIDEMVELSQRHGRYVIVSGLKDHTYRALKGMRVLDRVSREQQFTDRLEAIRAAVAFCVKLRERTPD